MHFLSWENGDNDDDDDDDDYYYYLFKTIIIIMTILHVHGNLSHVKIVKPVLSCCFHTAG